MASFDLREEFQSLQQDPSNYEVVNEQDISAMDERTATGLLEVAVESLADSSDNIVDMEVFDVFRSFLKHRQALQGPVLNKMLDSISSGFASQVDATLRDVETEDQQTAMAHRAPLEMYAFLLNWFVSVADSSKSSGGDELAALAAPAKGKRGRGGKAAAGRAASGRGQASKRTEEWNWMDQIPVTLALISKVLRLKTIRLWTASTDRDTFINCVTRPVYCIVESEVYMKSEQIRLGVYKAICLAVKHHGHVMAAQISIMQSLQYYEHLAEPMAECLKILAMDFDHVQLADEILREIAKKTFNAQDSKGPRVFSKFLIKLAESVPRTVLRQMSLLQGHLDSESYPMRMAIIEILGHLIRDLANSTDMNNDATQAQKQINSFYDILLERTLDIASYVRAKVLTVLTKLCDLPTKFPKQRLAVTRVAADMMEDKVANVRKAALTLLGELVTTHPYGLIHGGLMGLEEWDQRYQEVTAELKKVEDIVGKAVENGDKEGTEDGSADGEGGEEEEEDEEEHGVPDDEDEPRSKSKKKKTKQRNENEMDVDDEDDEEEEQEPTIPEGSDDVEMEDAEATPKSKKPKKSKKGRKSEIDMTALTNEQAALAALEGNQLLSLKLRKKYYSEALNFIRQVEGAIPLAGQLLGSMNKAEVLEAMEFFRIIHIYQFDGAEFGIKKMIHLIWSKDNSSTSEDGKELKGVRSRLLDCYKSLYFDVVQDLEPKDQINRIAKNMIELTYNATLAELTSLEEMMRIMMEADQIHGDIISKLWGVYSINRPLPKQQRRGAIIILGMMALARRSVVADRVDTLVKVGLGALGKADLVLARYTCVALQRLNGSAKKVKGSLTDKNMRLDMNNHVFRKLQDAMEHPCRTRDWFPMAEQAINTIYALGERPDELCDTLIKDLTKRALRQRTPAEDLGVEKDPESMDQDPPASSQPDNASTHGPTAGNRDVGDAFELSQLLFIVGHVAIKHIAYLELVERELKRQKGVMEIADKNAARSSKDGEELDQVVGNAEDEIGDRLATIRETELLYGPNSLLSIYGPMLVHVCGNPQKYKNRTLRAAAILSFSKFLCISSQFCDEKHHILFNLLKSSKDPNIRSNIVIALGDVAVCFSSIFDENSNELFKGLSDTDMVVKKNTLMVLTHLILNGMIKVKGQLGEMAKCLEDPEPRIADLAKLFFTELSTKDNAIYNNLPDVISHLSVGDHALDEENFQSTMKYIFTFIEKEKQAENIVEKLCQRFHLTEDTRQWRDIAFCLSLLPFKSERSVKKLIEGLQFYRDKLHEETVFARFQDILVKARTNKSATKPETELNEFEAILEQHKQQGEEDQALEKRVGKNKAVAKKRAKKTGGGRKKKAPTPARDDDMYASD